MHSVILFLTSAGKTLGRSLQPVSRNGRLEEGHAICVSWREMACPHVDLDGGVNKLGEGQLLIPRLAKLEEVLLQGAVLDVLQKQGTERG